MSYIDDARVALERELNERDADCEPALVDLYTLLVLTLGGITELEDVHDAWATWTARTDPEHRSLVPFHELLPDIQSLDQPYRDAIHAAADTIRTGADA